MTIHFESSIVKITKEGERILSSVLEEGERLLNGQTHDDVQENGIGSGTHEVTETVPTMTVDGDTGQNTVGGKATITHQSPDEPSGDAPEPEDTDTDETPASTDQEAPVTNETNQPTNDEGAPVDPAQPAAPVDTTPEATEDGPAVSATPTDESASNDDSAKA